MNKYVVIALIVAGVVAAGVYFHYKPLSTGCSCSSCEQVAVVEEVVTEEPAVAEESVEDTFEKAVSTEAEGEKHAGCECCKAHDKNEK